MVNRDGRRFVNEASDYNSMGGAFHQIDVDPLRVRNNPAWIVFDQGHLDTYGFLGVQPGGEALDWFNASPDLASTRRATIGVDADGLQRTVADWNANVANGVDPDFQRGESAYDSYWGDPSAADRRRPHARPARHRPYYAVPVQAGAMGTKGGPDRRQRPGPARRRPRSSRASTPQATRWRA